jgi:DNA-binding transcriptional ArsR family regulator
MEAQTDILFRSLADPRRRAIYESLARGGERTVRMLTEEAGISQPAVSKHLAVLKSAGLVRFRPDGRQTHYSANRDALKPLAGWIGEYGAFWKDRFDDLEDLLNRMDQ